MFQLSPNPGNQGLGLHLFIGEAVLSCLFPRREKEGPRLQQEPVVRTSSCSRWGRLVDHGVLGAAPQVGPRRSQLYPLPMTFVFLILCLLIFFNTKTKNKRIKPRALWNEVWGWVRGGLGEEVAFCPPPARGSPASRKVVVRVSSSCPSSPLKGWLSLLNLHLLTPALTLA